MVPGNPLFSLPFPPGIPNWICLVGPWGRGRGIFFSPKFRMSRRKKQTLSFCCWLERNSLWGPLHFYTFAVLAKGFHCITLWWMGLVPFLEGRQRLFAEIHWSLLSGACILGIGKGILPNFRDPSIYIPNLYPLRSCYGFTGSPGSVTGYRISGFFPATGVSRSM